MQQNILSISGEYNKIEKFFQKHMINTVFLVCGKSAQQLDIFKYFKDMESEGKIAVNLFSDFCPNPSYESVEKGVKQYLLMKCDCIVAIGGGSCIDVAKCIKLFINMDLNKKFLLQEIVPNNIKLFVIPTTAGTGSEATHFAVIYDKGEKLSIANRSCLPDTVFFEPNTLNYVPLYHKKATMFDALSHGIESYWSINSTEESKDYSRKSIQLLMKNMNDYFKGEELANQNMLLAANYAGKAINISKTTAGHAMCYKLTSLYGYAHGHAAIICNIALWKYMVTHMDDIRDKRGSDYLYETFESIAKDMECLSVEEAISKLEILVNNMGLEQKINKRDINQLIGSVNMERLKNNPIYLDTVAIKNIYLNI